MTCIRNAAGTFSPAARALPGAAGLGFVLLFIGALGL
jgi:hypothetical protein